MNMKSSNSRISHYTAQFIVVYDGKPWYGDLIYQIL